MLEEIHKEFCWYRDHGENVFDSKEKFLDFTDTVIDLIDISGELEEKYLDKNEVDKEEEEFNKKGANKMKKIYTWPGAGYSLHECVLNSEAQEALNKDAMEAVLCYLIDTDQCEYMLANDFERKFGEEESEGWVYIDNTGSEIMNKANCYYVLILEMKVIEE